MKCITLRWFCHMERMVKSEMVGRLCKRKIDALDIRGQSYVM